MNEACTNGQFVIFNDIVPVNLVAGYSGVRPVLIFIYFFFAKLKRNLKSKTLLNLCHVLRLLINLIKLYLQYC